MKHGNENKGRDLTNVGISKRISLGFTQKQGEDHPKMKYFDGNLMPFPSFPNLIDKPLAHPVYLMDTLKEEASDIMSLCQQFLDKAYEDENPMNDNVRTKIFGHNFGKSFHITCSGRFEFFEVFIESNATLNRHIDYSNDGDISYQYGCSYSYLILSQNDGKLYRVNFIMTTRLVCGQFMDKLK